MRGDMTFKIDIKGLKEEISSYSYTLDNAFFEAIDAPDVRSGNLRCDLTVKKATGYYELCFHTEGTVRIPCDRCLEDMDQPICTDNRLVVKLGKEYSEDDNLLTISEDEGTLDVAWLIYEFIAVSIPVRHAHAEGECDMKMMELLREYQHDSDEPDSTADADPRWAKLAELKDKN